MGEIYPEMIAEYRGPGMIRGTKPEEKRQRSADYDGFSWVLYAETDAMQSPRKRRKESEPTNKITFSFK